MKTSGKILTSVCVVLIVAIMSLTLVGCQGNADHDSFTLNGWEYIALQRLGKSASDVDITKLRVEDFIDLKGISDDTYLYSGGEKAANEEGWYPTLIDNFDVKYETESGLDPEIWTTSRHDVRWESQKRAIPNTLIIGAVKQYLSKTASPL